MKASPSLHFMIQPHLLGSGQWGETTKWERWITPVMPLEELCSAAFCIAITNEKIVLMRAERGWGMLGGHIEEGESVIDTLFREALEEGGFVIENYQLCGYRKITASIAHTHPTPGRAYPFPVSYIPSYLATSSRPLLHARGEEVLETAAFSIEEVAKLNSDDWPVIQAVWDIFQGNT